MAIDFCYEPGCNGTLRQSADQPYRYEDDGIPVILLGVTLHTCDTCGAETVAIPHLAELHELLASLIVARPGSLTGAEIRFLRKQMGLSSAALAELLGVSREWISACENGKQRLGQQSDSLLRVRYLLHSGELSQRLVKMSLDAPLRATPPPQPYQVPLELLAQQELRFGCAGHR
jgi:putative zinc finger/helix-turn-helix YgiT family protein